MKSVARVAAMVATGSLLLVGSITNPAHAVVEKRGGSRACTQSGLRVSIRAHGSELIRIYTDGILRLESNHGVAIYSDYYHSSSQRINSWRVTSSSGYLSDAQTYSYCRDITLK